MDGLYKAARTVLLGTAQCLVLLLAMGASAQANTIVRVSTTFGDFSLELFDTAAPATVQNFLNYVNRGAYNGSYFHRLERNFVLQSGAYRFVTPSGIAVIPTDPPIVNEFSESNVRGTVAMAKVGGNPNSATSQWFVNLADNSANLDAQNGGFTVFGRVLGDGMVVLDRINALDVYSLTDTQQNQLPLYNYEPSSSITAANLVNMNIEVVQRYSSALHVFESNSGLLTLTVDGGEAIGKYSLNLSLIEEQPSIKFRLNPDSMVLLAINPIGSAQFLNSANELHVPNLELNMNGDVSIISNVVLQLSDADSWTFTLKSYDQ